MAWVSPAVRRSRDGDTPSPLGTGPSLPAKPMENMVLVTSNRLTVINTRGRPLFFSSLTHSCTSQFGITSNSRGRDLCWFNTWHSFWEICADNFLSFVMLNGEWICPLCSKGSWIFKKKALIMDFGSIRKLGRGFYHNLPSNFSYVILGSWLVSLCVYSSRDETLFYSASHLLGQ